ncbi:MAG: BatA domain-containing protein [Bacteroidales bacterium]|nr:BatA domain-containing protein [Bacteroidales bacterium]
MEFIHPYWLFGLLAIAIPIIIHLFNFRRYKKLYFTNLKFLKSIKNETKKQNRLRHLLILISRILAITFLVIAFARPYIPGSGGLQRSAERFVSIYVDNSMSMQAAVNGHSLLDVAKAKAEEVAAAYGPSDRFQLLTNNFKGKHQQYYNRDEFVNLLHEVEISPLHRMLPVIYERMQESQPPKSTDELHFYLISDFQKSSFDLALSDIDTVNMFFFVPVLTSAFGNIYIDSCWFETPYNHLNQHQVLHISFVNASEIDLQKIPVRLMINGVQKALGTFDIAAEGKAGVNLPFNNNVAGKQSGLVMIEDYPVTWDDRMFLTWEVKDRIPVLLISEKEGGFYFSSLFANDSVFYFSEEVVNKLDYSRFSGVDLIVLDNITMLTTGLSSEVEKYVTSGGSLMLVPGKDADINTLNQFLSRVSFGQLMPFDTSRLMVTGLNTGHEIFSEVFESVPENPDLPFVRGHYPFRVDGNKYHDVIMDLQNGDSYISMTRHAKGKVYLLASPLGDEYGNLARHAIWVPLMYRMAMLSRPQEQIYYTMGKDEIINTGLDRIPGEHKLLVKLLDSDYEFIPGIQSRGRGNELLLYDRIVQAGHYELLSSDDLLMSFSFNYDRLESDPAIYTGDQIKEMIAGQDVDNVFVIELAEEQLSRAVYEFSQGTSFWKLFVWLSLFFILLEILLLRFVRR